MTLCFPKQTETTCVACLPHRSVVPSIIQLLPLPKCHLQTFTSRLLYDNLHAARRAEGQQRRRQLAAANRSTPRRANWFVKSICTGSTSGSVDRCANSAVRGPPACHSLPTLGVTPPFSIFLPPALHTLPIAPHSIATSSSRHPKRSSYEFDNSLQHVLSECQPSSCFFTVSCGRIDFVRLRIRVIGTLNEIRSNAFPLFHGSVRWSDRRVGRVSEAMPSRYSTSSPAQIVDACIMNGDFWGDLSTDMRLLAAADRMTETERAKAIRR
ncbi:BZ3500_MvSof-1268-A1-R1_Chr11-2g03357 [Microbotryum saponariae]|uniref:BZ3500_MvSof-1268-A1-R1_Chr11-2g03357 protein n=1 Tax=Microbotryum saponariae TaxID=289078 RepID=A0A2X0KN72_9BASI|nr:BZ3500_MvSof-1268-A1-R1_Chr11-2g03357 [Microbotryum saponariae]SDA03195.1 BZ3501_MvSof-1269-A2-R1_Chr11g02928 [Microbotryum saponariae]